MDQDYRRLNFFAGEEQKKHCEEKRFVCKELNEDKLI